jgi:hypothetical protein
MNIKLFQLLLVPKIKNGEYPACKKCIHFIENKDISFSRCAFFGEKNLITGEITYNYADLTRTNECSVSGKYFEKKP